MPDRPVPEPTGGSAGYGYGGWQHPGYAPRRPPPNPPAPPRPSRRWRAATTPVLVLSALAALGYAGWAMTARRSLLADLAADPTAVTVADAESSDRLNDRWLTAVLVLAALALVLWVLARVLGRLRFGAVGFCGLVMVVVGAVVAGGGSYLAVRGGADPAQAAQAVTGHLVLGVGYGMGGVGLLLGAVSLFRQPGVPTPHLGYADWSS